jgi:ATP-dependent Clp protease ATP-binding subunit ClpC
VGPPGVGKTALVHGLARAIVLTPDVVPGFEGRIIISIDAGALLSGTSFRGALSERIRELRDEVVKADGRVVVFLDEVHQLLDEQGADAANDLKTALSDGRFKVIAATTEEELRSKVETDPALLRRFTLVNVDEPTPEEARTILAGLKGLYEDSHQVLYTDDALDAAVRLSHRFIQERQLPHKALDLMDLAGVRARRLGRQQVDRELVAEVTAEMVDVPTERLLLTNAERLLRMEEEMGARVVGHGDAVRRLSEVVRRNQAGFAADRPIGSFLFLGPTGVGKTETAKVLADFLFDNRDSLTQVDMSEYAEPHAMARLIGSPPGYVGHEAGGQLTEAVRRRPYQVLLLDEVEKAHIDVLKVLLQVLEEGRLTDGRGRRVNFCNTVIILTSNLGAERFTGPGGIGARRRPGFTATRETRDDEFEVPVDPEILDEVMQDAQDHFPAELWNRIEEKFIFQPLSRADVAEVAKMLIADSSARLSKSAEITFEADDAAIRHLIENGGWSPQFGARPMRRTVQRLIETPIATGIVKSDYAAGDHLLVRMDSAGGALELSIE